MKIIVAAPAYTDASGGIMCLHHLSDLLCELGVDAYIAAESTFDANRAKLIPWDFKTPRPAPLGAEVPVIYPEVVFGNPLNSNHCIRWLLNAPGVVDGPKQFHEQDLLFAWGNRCHPEPPRKIDGFLKVFEPRLDLFQDLGLNRNLWLTLNHKGNPYRYHVPWSQNIDQEKFKGLAHMAALYQRARILISYDLNTFSSVQAALCGCISLVAPRAGVTAHQQRTESWYHKYGVAYGYTDIPRALRTLHLLRPQMEQERAKTLENIEAFIEILRQRLFDN